jgi:hypothetical protein
MQQQGAATMPERITWGGSGAGNPATSTSTWTSPNSATCPGARYPRGGHGRRFNRTALQLRTWRSAAPAMSPALRIEDANPST